MKNLVKYLLQTALGFKNYLYVFAIFKIKTLKYDSNEKDFFCFLELLKTDNRVLDIGANIGIMTTHLAKYLKRGEVHAFEPVPDNFAVLKKIVRKFKLNNVVLYPFALGNENKTIEMVLPLVNEVKMQGLSHVVHNSIDEFNEGELIKAESKTLDTVFSDKQKIDAIKIDVENFEYYTLIGGKSLLKRDRPVIYIELWDNENRQKCFELFKELEYSIHVVVDKSLQPYDPSKHRTQNFIVLPG